LKHGGGKGGWGSVYEVQGGVRKKVVRRPKNTAKGAAEWEVDSECRRSKSLCTNVVKFFDGKRPIDKMLLRVTDRELEVRKSGNNPKGLIDIKSGLG
jgi:hypothetical protein